MNKNELEGVKKIKALANPSGPYPNLNIYEAVEGGFEPPRGS